MPERAGEELGGRFAQAQPHSGRSCPPGWWMLSLPPVTVTSVTSPSKGPTHALSLHLTLVHIVHILWIPTADPAPWHSWMLCYISILTDTQGPWSLSPATELPYLHTTPGYPSPSDASSSADLAREGPYCLVPNGPVIGSLQLLLWLPTLFGGLSLQRGRGVPR